MNVFTASKEEVRFTGNIDSKGRITIPARIRNRLNLEKGDQVSLSLESCEVIREEVDSYREAVEFVQQFQDVKSFSFSEGIVEVVLDD